MNHDRNRRFAPRFSIPRALGNRGGPSQRAAGGRPSRHVKRGQRQRRLLVPFLLHQSSEEGQSRVGCGSFPIGVIDEALLAQFIDGFGVVWGQGCEAELCPLMYTERHMCVRCACENYCQSIRYYGPQTLNTLPILARPNLVIVKTLPKLNLTSRIIQTKYGSSCKSISNCSAASWMSSGLTSIFKSRQYNLLDQSRWESDSPN